MEIMFPGKLRKQTGNSLVLPEIQLNGKGQHNVYYKNNFLVGEGGWEECSDIAEYLSLLPQCCQTFGIIRTCMDF